MLEEAGAGACRSAQDTRRSDGRMMKSFEGRDVMKWRKMGCGRGEETQSSLSGLA
jgi:hypothetical protein